MEIYLTRGSSDTSTYPLDENGVTIGETHVEYDYVANWRLTSVGMVVLKPDESVLVTYNISLSYDSRGSLSSTTVIEGTDEE
jgi:hypothetical protein